jgi:electron transfer flavoprotein beta subunit
VKIIVCVKQVLDTAAKIRIKNNRVDEDGVPRILNPYDEYAVEEALLVRDKFPGSEITVITLGPENSRDALKAALAMGADKAIHLKDPLFDALDNQGVAYLLAQAIRTMSFDLILCGRQAVDDDMAGIGPALAIFLKIPFVSVVTQLRFSSANAEGVIVVRQVEGGAEEIEASLPALLTCQKGLNVPRLPSLKGIMAAKKKEIAVLDAKAVGFDPQNPGAAVNRVRQIDLSLPPVRKKGRILSGSPEETAKELVRVLREEEKVV